MHDKMDETEHPNLNSRNTIDDAEVLATQIGPSTAPNYTRRKSSEQLSNKRKESELVGQAFLNSLHYMMPGDQSH